MNQLNHRIATATAGVAELPDCVGFPRSLVVAAVGVVTVCGVIALLLIRFVAG